MDRIISARVRSQRWYTRYPRALPLSIFLLVLTIAGVSVYDMERVSAERTHSQMRAAATEVGGALERRSIAQVTYLRAGAMLISASSRVTPQSIRDLAAGMADDDENHGITGITWAPSITARDVPAFEAARQAEGLTNFHVHPVPSPTQDFLVPVTYVSRTETNPNPSLGYDMASEPQRRAAMMKAAHDHRPSATGKVQLVRHDPTRPWSGFLIYMPVYARTTDGGRLMGFVCSPFNARTLLESALAMVPSGGFGVRLYDGVVQPDRLLAQVPGPRNPDLSYAQNVTIADRTLVLVVDGRGHGPLSTLSMLTALFALLVAALLTTLAMVVTRHAQEDRASLAWLDEQVSIRNTLTRELNHRVKNTLANVLSIIALTRRRAEALDDFADSLTGRILALSATHDLLTGLGWGPAPLRDVIAMELKPYAEGRDHVVELGGPDLALAPNDALSLGLAVHELATNASKYGALSVHSGQVTVNWDLIKPGLARVTWKEQGGPPVPQQRRRGFGTDLIEKIVAHELGAGVDLRFEADGVRCVLSVPVRLPAVFQIRAPKGIAPAAPEKRAG